MKIQHQLLEFITHLSGYCYQTSQDYWCDHCKSFQQVSLQLIKSWPRNVSYQRYREWM